MNRRTHWTLRPDGTYDGPIAEYEEAIPERDLRSAMEALRWYADERNWSHVSEHGTITTNTPARQDAGQRARDALKGT